MARRRKSFVTSDQHAAFYAASFPGVFDPATHAALFALRAVAQFVNDRANEWLAPLGLNVGKYGYLVTLESAPGRRMRFNDLGRSMHTTNASVTTMIQTLERDGLVRRVPNPDDARSHLAELTPQGRRLARRAVEAQHAHVERALHRFPAAKRKQLTALLLELGEAFQDDMDATDAGARSARLPR